jgi:uncharacterized membrane protein
MAVHASKEVGFSAELGRVKKTEAEILRRIKHEEAKEEEIERLERRILTEIDEGKPHQSKVKRFTFADFGQMVVGAATFGTPFLLTPDTGNMIETIALSRIILMHLLFVGCVFITLNFAFRKSFSFDAQFLKDLTKRVFLIYCTVTLVMGVLLWMLNDFTMEMSLYEALRWVLVGNSVGLVGAVTFDFLAR